MGIIAWIVLGLAAGLVASLLVPGRRSQGLILTCLIGVAGALRGGRVATGLFHVHSLCKSSSTCPPGLPPLPARRSCCWPAALVSGRAGYRAAHR
jgi:uncharacterized membrane protein YeaQ/YmgE (transglycosylase-associated protein family)